MSQGPRPKVTRERLERACRMYRSNTEAAHALGVYDGSFSRACRREGIETPAERKRRERT